MPNWSGAAQGAIGGAAALAPLGPIGAGIGGLAGGILGLFGGGDTEEETRKRYEWLMSAISGMENTAVSQGVNAITSQARGLMAQSRAAAVKRAANAGVGGGDLESYILPAEGAISSRLGQRLSDYVTNTRRMYDQARLEAGAGYVGRPIQPGLGDYIMGIAGPVSGYLSNRDLLSAIAGMGNPNNQPSGQGDTINPKNWNAGNLFNFPSQRFGLSGYNIPAWPR
jgi:hypothetical protein